MESKLLLSVVEAAPVIGVGRSTVFSLIKSGKLRAVKIGGRTLIRPDDLRAFVDSISGKHAA